MPTTKTTLRTENSTIACSPPVSVAIQGKTKDAFKTASQKTQLMELEVVLEGTFPMGQRNLVHLQPGQKVYINHENTTQEWMKRTFVVDDKEFILVPSQYILLVRSIPWTEHTSEELGALVDELVLKSARPSPAPLPVASDGVPVGSGG